MAARSKSHEAMTLTRCQTSAMSARLGRKQMKPNTKNEIKGAFHQVKGKVKEKTGHVTNNPDSEADGKAEHNLGRVEKDDGANETDEGGYWE